MKYFRIIGIAVLTLALILTLMTACKKSGDDNNGTTAEVTTAAGEDNTTKEVWTGKHIDDTKKPHTEETEPQEEITREGNDYNGGGIELPPDKNV